MKESEPDRVADLTPTGVDRAEERLRHGEAASGTGTFEYDLGSQAWTWSPQAASLLRISWSDRGAGKWDRAIFVDDVPKIRAGIESAARTGSLYVEFRVTDASRALHWIAAKGQLSPAPNSSNGVLRGAVYEITDRKVLEARLLALNETLEARVAELREEALTLEIVNRTGVAVAAEHDLETLVQMVTDAGVELSHAKFGAFFYNVHGDNGEAYTLHTLSGIPREAFADFPMPRNTQIFEPTFRGRGPVLSTDILADPRYGKSAPYHGMPSGHVPVRSYLAVPVSSRSGEVLGGLFFAHPEPGVFTERAERLMVALASQAAVAIDNARLHQASQREIAARREAELALQRLNETLEERALERAQQLASSLNRLEETERKFRLLVEGVTDYAIYMLDPDGRVVNWNLGAERIKGYEASEIIGKHFSIFYTPDDQRAGVPQKALAFAKANGKYEAEAWRVRKGGGRFWAGVMLNLIKNDQGEVVGLAKITRDLTEKRSAEERLRQAQKLEAIGQLTGGVAHDFNNLLTIISGNLETLHRNLDMPELDPVRLRRSAENAIKGSQRAQSLTQRLLAFSRQQPLDPRPVDIGRLVTSLSDLLRRSLGEQVTIETVLGGGLWLAHADPGQLEVAILNLAVNARDAMPSGGKLTLETANVDLDERYAASQGEVVPGQYVMLAISDNGSGMPPEVKARAFDPFFTTKEIGQGTGLGLSQVYGFIKQSRGHVKIYSEVGEGTTIRLYLPRIHASETIATRQADAPLARSAGKEVILVVEDDPDVRIYSSDTLRELGYTVVEAGDGRTGLRALSANPDIQLLFTDVGLPGGMNGRQLAEQARNQRPNLKVLFTSGYARNAIVHDGQLDPGVELITKPFTQAALSAKLRNILDARRIPGRILLVEDEVLIQMIAAEYLEGAGFHVDRAGSGAEAMNKLALVPGGVDVVIVDVELPDIKGDALIREMRATYGSLPVLFASGGDVEELRAAFGDDRRIAFISKPYNEASLLGALRTLGVGRL